MTKKQQIADLVKEVKEKLGSDRANSCAVDCLYQWEAGELDEALKLWKSYINAVITCKTHSMMNRNGVSVPCNIES